MINTSIIVVMVLVIVFLPEKQKTKNKKHEVHLEKNIQDESIKSWKREE